MSAQASWNRLLVPDVVSFGNALPSPHTEGVHDQRNSADELYPHPRVEQGRRIGMPHGRDEPIARRSGKDATEDGPVGGLFHSNKLSPAMASFNGRIDSMSFLAGVVQSNDTGRVGRCGFQIKRCMDTPANTRFPLPSVRG